jgi:hypothetical protein
MFVPFHAVGKLVNFLLVPRMYEYCRQILCTAGADPGFVGPEAYTIFPASFKKKNIKL